MSSPNAFWQTSKPMKAFLDTGFLLALLMELKGSRTAWQLTRQLSGPLQVAQLQCFHIENRLLRETRDPNATENGRATAAAALQNLRTYLDELIFQAVDVEYDLAIDLANQWQRHSASQPPAALLILCPAIAATVSATHFLSFDPRPRGIAKAARLKLLPENL